MLIKIKACEHSMRQISKLRSENTSRFGLPFLSLAAFPTPAEPQDMFFELVCLVFRTRYSTTGLDQSERRELRNSAARTRGLGATQLFRAVRRTHPAVFNRPLGLHNILHSRRALNRQNRNRNSMGRDPPPKAKRPKLKHDGDAGNNGVVTEAASPFAVAAGAEPQTSAGTGSNNNDNVTANTSSIQQEDLARPPPQQQQHGSVTLPLSLQLGLGLRPFWSMCACCNLHTEERTGTTRDAGQPLAGPFGEATRRLNNKTTTSSGDRSCSSSALVAAAPSPSPQRNLVLPGNNDGSTVESLIHQYISACHLYGCSDRINAGVLTTLRFSLPTLRASGSFHDADMLALCEILLPHCNGALSHIRRL